MDVLAAARANGIDLRTSKTGSYKTLCPQCSSSRKKSMDRCLSVRVDETGIVERKNTWGFKTSNFMYPG